MSTPDAATQLPYAGDDPAGITAFAAGIRDGRAQLSTFDAEVAAARSGLTAGWRAVEAQVVDARTVRLASNGQLLAGALDAAAAAVSSYADVLVGARTQIDGLRDEWSTAAKKLQAYVDMGPLPAEELTLAQQAADRLSASMQEITERWGRVVAQVAEGVESCRRALSTAAQASSETNSDGVMSLTGGLPSSMRADVAALIANGTLPPEAARMTLAEFTSHAESDWADRLDSGLLFPLPAGSMLSAAVVDQLNTMTGATYPGTTAESLAATFGTMSPEEKSWMALLYPRYLGNRDGVPFEVRAQANRVMISAELGREQQRLTGYQALDAEAQRDKGFWDWNVWDDNDQDGNIENSQAKISFYENMLNGKVENYGAAPGEPDQVNHQVLYFDPVGNGMFAEMIGDIDEHTRNVGVLVPGTNTTMVGGGSDRAESFVKESGGDLTMIYWAAGNFPQNAEAASTEANNQLAPSLVEFTHEVNRTIDGTGRDIPVTVAGHSYGGATVGTAETQGLEADRILFIESAGAGTGVESVADYHDANPDVERFSMTAPGDFIEIVQGNPLSPHGVDPDALEGVTRLHTGNFPDGYQLDGVDKSGQAIEGFSAHSNVFTVNSDAWNNMYNVLTGGSVTPYVAPHQDIIGYYGDGRPILGPVEFPADLPAQVPVDR